jgi:DNA-binding transcriptional regulator YdaS (Cro superfamily)
LLVDGLQVFLFSSPMPMGKDMTGIAALRQAIRHHLKSQVAVARAVGVTPQAVSDVLRRNKRVPAEWCLALERATQGAITRHDLRPDLYPAAERETP